MRATTVSVLVFWRYSAIGAALRLLRLWRALRIGYGFAAEHFAMVKVVLCEILSIKSRLDGLHGDQPLHTVVSGSLGYQRQDFKIPVLDLGCKMVGEGERFARSAFCSS